MNHAKAPRGFVLRGAPFCPPEPAPAALRGGGTGDPAPMAAERSQAACTRLLGLRRADMGYGALAPSVPSF